MADEMIARQTLTTVWWLILLRAVVLLVVGLAFLLRPDLPITAAIVIMGAYWFVDGILTVTRSVKARHSVGFWGLGVAVGAISIVAGLVVFSHPFASARLTATFLMAFLGIAAVISGVSSIVTGVRLRRASGGETYLLVGGGVSVVFGILLLTSPMYSILMLVKILGAVAVIVGIALLIESLRIRRAAGLLALALAVGLATVPDAAADPPHLREGVTFGVAAGYSPGRASMFPDDGAARSDSDWEMGVTPQFRLGYAVIKNRLLALVAVQQWAYEQGVLADDKGRINAQNWTLSLTWCPGDPHGATGGIQVTAGIGVANARLTLLQPLENDPHGDTFEEVFKEDEQGTAYQIGIGYEFRLTRALAAGLSVSYIHQAIDGWIFEDTSSVPLNLTLNWYW